MPLHHKPCTPACEHQIEDQLYEKVSLIVADPAKHPLYGLTERPRNEAQGELRCGHEYHAGVAEHSEDAEACPGKWKHNGHAEPGHLLSQPPPHFAASRVR